MSVKKTIAVISTILLIAILAYFIYENNKLSKILQDTSVPRTIKQKTSNTLIVKFKANQSPETKKKVLDKYAGPVKKKINHIGAYEIKPEDTSVQTAVSNLNKQPSVEYAEPNHIREILITPNDPYFANQYGPKLISGPEGWDIEKGNSNPVTIAVVDTGVDLSHPDLSSKIVQGFDIINNDSNPSDDHGHGTHVAGIAAAITNNSVGVAGTSWGAKIMPVKVLSASGSGTDVTVSQGIIWAADHGAKVINLSLGGYGYSQTMQDATDYALSKGVAVLAAAGNSGSTSILYPAGNRNVLGVGAIDSSSKIAYFSNHNSSVDLSAPGVSILSTYLRSGSYSYAYLSGTSMATPFASGVAALAYSKFPNYTASQITQRICSRSVDLGIPGRDDYYGHGRVDIKLSVTEGSEPSPPPPTPKKSVRASLNRSIITRGNSAIISGQITPQKAGERVIIQRRYSPRAAWGIVSRPITNSRGRFSKRVRPLKTVYFRVIYGNTVTLKLSVIKSKRRR